MSETRVPVITLDGPSGTGKGTISAELARKLGWHWLDSGSIYRAMAWALNEAGVADNLDNDSVVTELKKHVISVGSRLAEGGSVCWASVNGQELGDAIRTEECSQLASKISAFGGVRDLVLGYQRSFAQSPGLVTDGRDMGTVVFPDAALKCFLTASPQERAKRRQNQLQEKGNPVSLPEVLVEIEERDERDASRAIAPMQPAADALIIDTSDLSIDEVMEVVLQAVQKRSL